MAESGPPDGHFLGWTPGKTSSTVPEGMPWVLKPGSALLLQPHMLPTGEPEEIQCTIGLHFTPTPPRRRPFMILLRNDSIDVAAGKWLLNIDDWDFNWQEEYRFVDPPSLPKGTKLVMRFSYDNSADNPRNPNYRRNALGSGSAQSMRWAPWPCR